MTSLDGSVAVVTGASRNLGRGIAHELGIAGATVYVTGRSFGDETTVDHASGTVDGTADLVTAAGGEGIAVRCDHTDDEQVEALFSQIEDDHGRVDVLVNNVWGGYEGYGDDADFTKRFWEQPLRRWEGMFDAGVRTHFTASRLAAPLMIPRGRGLIVNTTYWERDRYFPPVPYFVAKAAINHMAYGMGLELLEHEIATVALSPGWIRTEQLLEEWDTDDETAHEIDELEPTTSTRYAGRAVVALATDPDVMRHTGRTLTAGGLASEYGFEDVDGRQPGPYSSPAEMYDVPRSLPAE